VSLASPALELSSQVGRPRVETHPPYAYSYGDQLAQLMVLAKRPMHPHQRRAAELMTAVRSDGKWACRDYVELEPRQNGKGVPAEARVVGGLLLFGEELLTWTAHRADTATEMFRRVVMCIRNLGDEAGRNLYVIDGVRLKVREGSGKEGIERLDPLPSGLGAPGGRLLFGTRTPDGGRGFSGDVNIIDEALEFNEMQQEALQPTMRARPNPQTIYLSSPPRSPELAPILYRLRRRGDPTAPRTAKDGPWQQDPSLGYRDFGLGGDLEHLEDVDLDDRKLWAFTNPLLNTLISEESMATDRLNMSDVGFARECYGIWPRQVAEDEEGSGEIDMEAWAKLALKAEQIERPREVVFTAVVNAQRTQTVIAAVGPRRDGRIQVSLSDVIAGTDRVVARLAALRETRGPHLIVVQDKGPSATLVPDLKAAGLKVAADRDKPRRGDIVIPWADEVAQAYGLFVDAMTQDRIRHLDEELLNLSARHAETRPLGSGTAWGYKHETAAALNAVTLGLWAYLIKRPLIVEREDSGVWVL
jgi:hypothetical protein